MRLCIVPSVIALGKVQFRPRDRQRSARSRQFDIVANALDGAA